MVMLTNMDFAQTLGEGKRKDRHNALLAGFSLVIGFGPNEQGFFILDARSSIAAKSVGQLCWW